MPAARPLSELKLNQEQQSQEGQLPYPVFPTCLGSARGKGSLAEAATVLSPAAPGVPVGGVAQEGLWHKHGLRAA